MSDTISAREIIERLVKLAGIRKKLALEILHGITEIIEEGLKRDGEVRVKGLGTFRLKWVRGRIGRNPKTGTRVEIPAHNRLVFLPERSFKEYINRDSRLLSYKILAGTEEKPTEENIIPGPESELQPEPERSKEYHFEPALQPQFQPEPESQRLKRRIHWIAPVAVSIIVILSLIFYFRNCYHSEVISRQLSVVSQQSAVDSQQSSVASQQSAVDSQQSFEN